MTQIIIATTALYAEQICRETDDQDLYNEAEALILKFNSGERRMIIKDEDNIIDYAVIENKL